MVGPTLDVGAAGGAAGCFTTTSWAFEMGGLDFLHADDPVARADRARSDSGTSGLALGQSGYAYAQAHGHGRPTSSGRLLAFQGSQFHVKGQTTEGFGGVIRQACVREEGAGLVYQLELPVTAAERAQEVYRECCLLFNESTSETEC
jgi:hypothetical protein